MNIHRDFKLNNELYYVVLRMVQLRDSYKKTGKGTQIQSVKYRGKELGTAKELTGLVLSECDINVVKRIAESIGYVRKKYIDSGLIDPKVLAVDVNALIYQVPGGMLSNLLSQLKQAGKEDQLNDVLNEVPRVRKDAGFIPLVTPTSQIIGTQAVFNVITGERYKTVTKEFKGVVRGEYGKTPVPIDPEFRKKIIGDAEPIDCRPADLLKPELDTIRKECAEWVEQEEDVLSYAQFGQVAVKFFEKRRNKKYGVDGKHSDKEKQVHPV